MKKKCIIFSFLVAMLFAVGIVSASAAITTSNYPTLYSAGLPIDILFEYQGSYGSITSSNVYLYDGQTRATASSTSIGWRPVIGINQAPAAADVYITPDGADALRFASTMSFNPWNMTEANRQLLNATIGIAYDTGVASPTVTTEVLRTYNIRAPYQRSDGTMGWANIARNYTMIYGGSSGDTTIAYNMIPLFTNDELNAVLDSLEDEGVFTEQAIVTSIEVYPQRTTSSTELDIVGYYIDNATRDEVLYTSVASAANQSVQGLYEVEFSYDGLDWTLWLKNAVAGFMNFEIVPGLPLWGIVSAVVGIPLLVWFLRMFAGG